MLKRCPQSILDGNIRSLVPYFFHYLASSEYPDGRGRLYQPTKMLFMFDVWAGIYRELTKPKEK